MLPEEVKKQRLHVTVGRKVKDRVFEEWETLGYSSASDLVNTALIEFFAREDYRNELKRKKEK
jgi:Arc/MetJ-type ribon-helix-helix transcriptional regulator